MAKWPDVPDVFGWLSLDRRGRWLLRGEPIANKTAVAFIGRNYASDKQGRWFFQNGPQRVFVTLDYTPWVYFVDGTRLHTHTGLEVARVDRVCLDENGQLLLRTEHGPGIVCDRDLDAVAHWFCDRDGSPMRDDSIADAIAATVDGRQAELFMTVPGDRVAVSFVQSAHAPDVFSYATLDGGQELET